MKARQDAGGARLLDVLTVHYYPQGGEFSDDASECADCASATKLSALPPAIWGAQKHINGATAQAYILGIFGREGVDVANRWATPDSGTPAYNAIRMYRNYDGRKSAFGDVSVHATAPDPDALSAFAATRTSDGALTVMLVSKALSGDHQRLESHADRSRERSRQHLRQEHYMNYPLLSIVDREERGKL